MSTRDFYKNYYAKECSGNGSEIPTVPHTLESPFKDRLISRRGAICTCAAAVACMGSGLGFGTLIPADQTPQIVQLQKELENKNKKINELIELAFEDDEDSTVLNQLSKDNETRKGFIENQNKEILKLQGERDAQKLQIDQQLQKIKKLEEKNKELDSKLKKLAGDGLKDLLNKFCKTSGGTAIGVTYGTKKFTKVDCNKLTKVISSEK